jgi:hypothetical protein
MQIRLRHILAVAVGTVISVAGLGCKLGPINYDKFEKRTIVENLAAIDSASSIYASLLAAGNIDAACAQAQAFLLTQEGVDTALISPDSLVWAFFSSGLLAGTGDVRRDTAGSSVGAPASNPVVRVAGGGETGGPMHYALPFNVELPGTQRAADAIRDCIGRRLPWSNELEVFTGDQVDVGIAEGFVKSGTGALFWSGHGLLMPLDPGPGEEPGILMGRPYDAEGAAEAVATVFSGYANPGAGRPRQIAVCQLASTLKYHLIVMPEFIRVHGDFDNAESLPQNATKTIVYLSCCFGAYSAGAGPGPLVQAFLDAGADLVCGYSWSVGDAWSCEKDTTFFRAMADTCLPGEARKIMGGLVDPVPGKKGIHAEFRMHGDTWVLLQTVLDAKKRGTLYRSCAGARAEMYTGQVTKLYVWERQDGSEDEAAYVTILFPSTAPGTFDLFSSGAYIQWDDIASGRTYFAQAGYIGTSGTLIVDRCSSDCIVGHFQARLGWWDMGKSPYVDPPSDTFSLTDGVLKYTGKITSYGALDPHRLAAELRPSLR